MSIHVTKTGLPVLLLTSLAVLGCNDPTRPEQRMDQPLAAAATNPVHEVLIDDPEFALPDIDCGTFTIRETSFSDRVQVTTYFNAAGDPVRVRVHTQFHGVLTNLATGKTIRDHGAFTNTFNFTQGTLTQTGITFHYTLPHEGLQLADNGRIVFDLETGEVLSAAGHRDNVGQDLTAICPLLA
jgi:hypothetical protein